MSLSLEIEAPISLLSALSLLLHILLACSKSQNQALTSEEWLWDGLQPDANNYKLSLSIKFFLISVILSPD